MLMNAWRRAGVSACRAVGAMELLPAHRPASAAEGVRWMSVKQLSWRTSFSMQQQWRNSRLAALFPRVRRMSEKQTPGGVEPGMLNSKSKKEVQGQVRAMGRKSWGEWMKDHQDEILVVLLSSMFLLATLRLLRQKGEAMEAKIAFEARIEDLEAQVDRIKFEIRKSISEGAGDIASDFGSSTWGVKEQKVGELKRAMLKLVDAGAKKATEEPKEEEMMNGTFEDLFAAETPQVEQQRKHIPKMI